MSTLTVNTTSNSGRIQSSNATYATARSGGTLTAFSTLHTIGQTTGFNVFASYLDFDTSSIPIGSSITAVTLQLWGTSDFSTTDFIVQARLFDYGSSLTSADWVAGASMGALPLLATFATSGGWATSAYNTFTENGTTFRTNLNLGGITRIIVVSDRTVSGTAPTGNEDVVAASHDSDANSAHWPLLTVTYAASASRTVSSTTGLKATLTRTLSSTARLKATLARTLSSSTLFKASVARTVSSTSLLTLRLTRTVSSTSLFRQTLARTIASTTLLSGSPRRTITSTTLLAFHQLTPLEAGTTSDGVTGATGDGAIHAVMTGSGATKARFS